MKIWRFYKKPDDRDLVFDERSLSLYAITNNKKYAKKFIKERNMNLFIVKKSEEDSGVWKDFANKYRDAVLDIFELSSKQEVDGNSPYKKIDIPFLCTMYEYQSVDADFIALEVLDEGFWVKMLPPSLFTKKIKQSLEILEYHNLFKIFNTKSLEDFDDYSGPETSVDEAGCFVHEFYRLFK